MKSTEKAIRDFCGYHADWWPSTTQVQEMLALAQPCPTCEALARTVMLDQTSHDTKRPWVGLTDADVNALQDFAYADDVEFIRHIEAALKENNT
jgi:bacterioferritin-associated ferredoxin